MLTFKIVTWLALVALGIAYLRLKFKIEEEDHSTERIQAGVNRIKGLVESLAEVHREQVEKIGAVVDAIEKVAWFLKEAVRKMPEPPEMKAQQATLDAVRELLNKPS